MTPATTTEAVDPTAPPQPKAPHMVYVYEWPVRIWHWMTALAIAVLVPTGYFIAQPLHSLTGEASDHYFNGLVRTGHFVAAYVLSIGILVRIYWLFFGNKHAREIFFVPLWRPSFLKELWHELTYYALLRKVAGKHVGHNALARTVMFFVFFLGVLGLICSGFGLYSEGTAHGSWQRALFGWTISFAGSSMTLRTWHHMTMYYVLTFVLVHLYLVAREDILGRASQVSTMISGWRYFRDDSPVDKDRHG
jgi:Ni/Fe-hydrogenase 1 B-type cytochrome subunit